MCLENCKVDFHPVCWKKQKSTEEGKTGDKVISLDYNSKGRTNQMAEYLATRQQDFFSMRDY